MANITPDTGPNDDTRRSRRPTTDNEEQFEPNRRDDDEDVDPDSAESDNDRDDLNDEP